MSLHRFTYNFNSNEKKKEFIISDDDAAHGSFHEYFIYCLLARRWLCQQKKNGTMQLRADHNQEATYMPVRTQ